MMIRKIAPCPAALLAAVLSLSSCTTGFVKTEPIPGDPGRAREITRTCNWKDTGQWLNPVEAPNSPFLPFNRGSRFSFGMDVMAVVATLGISLVGDLFISPLAYAFNRDCKETERAVSAPSGKPPSAGAASPEPARPASEPVITDKPANRPVYRPKADPLAYAILIGIGRYRGVAEVPYARFDQESARMVFWKAFGVPEENIRSLGDSFATKSDIDVALNTWLPRELARLKGRKARVYVYYSGHGISDPASRAAYLLPFDGRPEAPLETAVPLSEVYKALAHPSIEAGLVVLDSCFSGAGGPRTASVKGGRPLVSSVDMHRPPPHTAVLSAATGTEIAGNLSREKRGLFTYHFVEGLSGRADKGHDNLIFLPELYEYVRAKVIRDARAQDREQTPQLLYSPPGPWDSRPLADYR